MGLFDVLSQLEEAFFARARVATQETLDGVSDALQSVCSLVAASLSPPSVASSCSSPVPSETASLDDDMAYAEELFSAPSSGHLSSDSSLAGPQDDSVSCVEEVPFEGESRTQDLEQAQDYSDAQTPAPVVLHDDLTSLQQVVSKELPVLFCEQNLCGARGEALLPEASKNKKQGEEGREESQDCCEAEFLIQSTAGRACKIDDLGKDCLAHVMSFLDNPSLQACSLVCQQWLEASNFARSDVRLSASIPVEKLPPVLTRFDHLLVLHIVSPDQALPLEEGSAPAACFDDKSLRLIAEHCKRLRKLHVAGSGFSDGGLSAFLKGCSELTDLGLTECNGFSGEGFLGLTPARLEKLVLEFCSGVTSSGLEAIGAACPGLNELGVVRKLRDASLMDGVHKVAGSCPSLVNLRLHACKIDDDTLSLIAARNRKLVEVYLSCEFEITDSGMGSLCCQLPCLEKLSLKNNVRLHNIPHSGPYSPLKALTLSNWYDTADAKLWELSWEKNLEVLSLLKCCLLSDFTVDRILSCCRSLKLLVISDNETVTPEIFRAYARSGCTAVLEIRRCARISLEAVPEGMRDSGKIQVQE